MKINVGQISLVNAASFGIGATLGLAGRSVLNAHTPINRVAFDAAMTLAALESALMGAKTAQEERTSMKTAAAYAIFGTIFGMNLPDVLTDASLYLGQTPLGPASQKLVDSFIDNKEILCFGGGLALAGKKLLRSFKKTEECTL